MDTSNIFPFFFSMMASQGNVGKVTSVDFPAVVLMDCEGNDLYEIGQKEYREI